MRDITNKILNQTENPKIKLIEEINEIKTKSNENEDQDDHIVDINLDIQSE